MRPAQFRLAIPVELLDEAAIRAALPPESLQLLAGLELHDSLDSTNTHLLRRAAAGAPAGLAALAECQTAGRGRRGRAWVSPPGANLYLSLLWRYPLAPAALGGVSLAIGVTLAETLTRMGAPGLALKWPNDLLWRGRKLAGVLVEAGGGSQGPSHLVAGVGLNLRMRPEQGLGIDQPWVTLDGIMAGQSPERNRLAGALIGASLTTLAGYAETGLTPFLDRWRHFDAFRETPVALRLGERLIHGIPRGIAPDGALLLDTADGLRACHAGEVSPRQSA